MSTFRLRSASRLHRLGRQTSSESCGPKDRSGLLSEAQQGRPIRIDRRGFLGMAAKGGIALAAASASLLPVVGHKLDALAVWTVYECDGCSSRCRWQYGECWHYVEYCFYTGGRPSCDGSYERCQYSAAGRCVVTWAYEQPARESYCPCYRAVCDVCSTPSSA